eukprot:550347-Pleurochrysis_carterae.AAC.1
MRRKHAQYFSADTTSRRCSRDICSFGLFPVLAELTFVMTHSYNDDQVAAVGGSGGEHVHARVAQGSGAAVLPPLAEAHAGKRGSAVCRCSRCKACAYSEAMFKCFVYSTRINCGSNCGLFDWCIPFTSNARAQPCNRPETSAGGSAPKPSVADERNRRQQAALLYASDAAYDAAFDAECSECDESQQAAEAGSSAASSSRKRPAAFEFSKKRNTRNAAQAIVCGTHNKCINRFDSHGRMMPCDLDL